MMFKFPVDTNTFKAKLNNSFMLFDLVAKPADLNKDGMQLALKHNSKYVPKDGAYEATQNVKFGYDLESAQIGLTVSISINFLIYFYFRLTSYGRIQALCSSKNLLQFRLMNSLSEIN